MLIELKIQIIRKFGSQIVFARSLQTDPSFVSKVIRGHFGVTDKTKEKWARALDCRVEDIFTVGINQR